MTWITKGTWHNAKSSDLTGQRFGRLTVIARDGIKAGKAAFLVRCDCGREKTVAGQKLRQGVQCACGRKK